MELSVLDLNDLLRGLMKMLRRLLGEDIAMSLHGQQSLPRVEADAGMVEQVVINLCVNARDAMSRGGQLILRTEAVEVSAEAAAANAEARAGHFVRLSVTDTGCGMDEKTQRRIFEPFFTTKEIGKGTGLGLATVYGIAKQHRGWVEVESAVGRGTTFRVHLPVCENPAEVARETEKPQPARGRNETVLVVEDEPGVRIAAGIALQHHGYRVIAAANGPEALRQWQEHRDEIDLLLTDMVMPGGMNGRELANKLREERPGLKVIFCTGYSQVLAKEQLEAGVRITILRKPFDQARLLNEVRRCLDET
jgi:CheY-like chemotaxis protein